MYMNIHTDCVIQLQISMPRGTPADKTYRHSNFVKCFSTVKTCEKLIVTHMF
jgi:hypothetical protein